MRKPGKISGLYKKFMTGIAKHALYHARVGNTKEATEILDELSKIATSSYLMNDVIKLDDKFENMISELTNMTPSDIKSIRDIDAQIRKYS